MRRRAVIAVVVAALALAAPAQADPVAHISAFRPDDPGYRLQWNFKGRWGIRMPQAWTIAQRRGAPGGRGTVVAVLDTGVAYRAYGGHPRAPDLPSFAPGYDFVGNDAVPVDENGHGTHVAGTIAAGTDNGVGAAGIAYRARIMPVRVLDARGDGDVDGVAQGIRWAADHGADVMNLSFEFPPDVQAREIEPVLDALRHAREQGVVVVASSGNKARPEVAYPARAPEAIAVGATTERGCRATYSDGGADLDVVAPGGGACAAYRFGAPIYQQTFGPGGSGFGAPRGYRGTSFAAPHVAGVAALMIAVERRAGRRSTPAEVQVRLERTARDLGPAGFDPGYGHGLIDAAAALR